MGARRARWAIGGILLALGAGACGDAAEQPALDGGSVPPPTAAAPDCTDPAVRDLVQRFGARLREVSLLAPDSVLATEMRSAYAELVAPELLSGWLADPATAPGRRVSSPWPQRIEIAEIDADEAGACAVRGEVIYATSADTSGAAAGAGEAVTLMVTHDAGWRISGYERTQETPADTTTADTTPR